MRKLLITLFLLSATATAMADSRHYYRQPPHRSHNAAPWVAGIVGLGILGAIASQQYQSPRRSCWDEVIGYDRYGREVWQRYCQ